MSIAPIIARINSGRRVIRQPSESGTANVAWARCSYSNIDLSAATEEVRCSGHVHFLNHVNVEVDNHCLSMGRVNFFRYIILSPQLLGLGRSFVHPVHDVSSRNPNCPCSSFTARLAILPPCTKGVPTDHSYSIRLTYRIPLPSRDSTGCLAISRPGPISQWL